jgi:hypothetical protein
MPYKKVGKNNGNPPGRGRGWHCRRGTRTRHPPHPSSRSPAATAPFATHEGTLRQSRYFWTGYGQSCGSGSLNPDPAFQVNPDPDTDPDLGFDDQNLKKKITAEFFFKYLF